MNLNLDLGRKGFTGSFIKIFFRQNQESLELHSFPKLKRLSTKDLRSIIAFIVIIGKTRKTFIQSKTRLPKI